MEKLLVMMVGVPGVGKSAFIKENFTLANVVSRDAIRFSLVSEDEEYFSKEKEVYQVFVSEIKKSLENNFLTVVDATHINCASRTKLLRALGKSLKGVKVTAVVLLADIETILKQNANRTGRELVPEEAVMRMANNFDPPRLEEGFDTISFYKDGELVYVLGGDWEAQ